MRAIHTKLRAENEYYQAKLKQFNPPIRNDLNMEKSQKILIGMPVI